MVQGGGPMTKLDRSKAIRFLVFVLLVIGAASCSQQSPAPSEPVAKPSASVPVKASAAVREQIAKTYGLDGFGKVEAIKYTWNAQFPGVNVSRSWEWEPKTGQVSYEGKDKDGKPIKVTYLRSQLSSAPANVKDEIEPAFVNDNYWAIFPFHVYWDTSANVEEKDNQKLPIGKGTAKLVSVKYPAEVGGYTPGDTWDRYVGSDGRVVQFIYHRGGPKKPRNATTTRAVYKK